jgi:hypothetical protein
MPYYLFGRERQRFLVFPVSRLTISEGKAVGRLGEKQLGFAGRLINE